MDVGYNTFSGLGVHRSTLDVVASSENAYVLFSWRCCVFSTIDNVVLHMADVALSSYEV
jgi:hypothetical protein